MYGSLRIAITELSLQKEETARVLLITIKRSVLC